MRPDGRAEHTTLAPLSGKRLRWGWPLWCCCHVRFVTGVASDTEIVGSIWAVTAPAVRLVAGGAAYCALHRWGEHAGHHAEPVARHLSGRIPVAGHYWGSSLQQRRGHGGDSRELAASLARGRWTVDGSQSMA